ncbi:MAG: class I SAM-dependent methyltransferase [Candidatus Didemnitutus sp.]|nr:class I SAM-dependent methyltransferase [Candidatus Didemnitutus sp.]
MRTIEHPQLPGPLHIGDDEPSLSRDELIALYWHHHPRFRFLKMAPRAARLLDLGAGSGGLAVWKQWQAPARPDLELHGCDLQRGEYAARYAAFHVLDFDGVRLPYPDGFFSAALSSHVIEHLRDQEHFAREIHRVLQPGGRVYIETPTEASCRFPPREFFLRAQLPTTTINFFDDHTHTRALRGPELTGLFERAGFATCEAGVIRTPYLEEVLLAKAAARQDEELGSYGLWSKLGFAHYGLFEKPRG